VSGQNLAFAYFDFDEETVAKIVASNRARAGLPKPSLAMLNDALMDLRCEHVKAALHCYGGKGHTDLNYHLVEWAKSFDLVRKGRFFMEDVVRQYVVSEEPQLSRLKDSLFRAVARLSENANASTVLEEIKYVLFSWRLLMEPLQRLEAAKGRDEPRSLELYHQLQKLYTELFDEGLRRELALTLARVAQSRFMFLPAASEEIDEAVRSMEIAAQTTK
jgi:hypothetical protein